MILLTTRVATPYLRVALLYLLTRTFVYRVTPRGLEQQLMDACEEATRSVARSLQHLEVYGLRCHCLLSSKQ